MAIRQPIVSVLGHVDHGKTKLLDRIRGTSVQSREAGSITQHIGATEVPIDHIYKVCGNLIRKKFDIPGLLFIDTPGHHSFMTLRARGGSLADIAVLVIDIREGIKPQTIESIRILRQYKTPFVIAMNKVDTIQGWSSVDGRPFILSEKQQQSHTKAAFDEKLYNIIAQLSEEGVYADRYDRIEDFTKAVALVPLSAKEGEGIPDLLLVLIGLAQRFLESQLKRDDSGPGKGTILEIKEEKGIGSTIDLILYAGTLKRGDTVALGTRDSPHVTRVKAILKPKPLDEIMDPRNRFDSVKEVTAAAGVKIACQSMDGVVSGAPLMVVSGPKDPSIKKLTEESAIKIETQDNGLMVKADAIGSLEALAYEAKAADIPIRKYGVGDISRRDIMEVAAHNEDVNRVILGFNVSLSKEAESVAEAHNVRVFSDQVVYHLIEEYVLWRDELKKKSDIDKRSEFSFPGKFILLPNCTFRVSKPAIVGVRILSGRLRPGQRLITRDGKDAGRVRSLRSGEEVIKEASQGDEVAVAIDEVTAGRQISEGDVIYVDMIGSSIKEMGSLDLDTDERMTLDEIIAIKRKSEPFWGM
ncbi:MAG: translation initiation factor IF-2 [Candidatus Methanomethylophilaceae archaeon]|jgi:translation initiation factor 5B|nr:translation initiation factor IF-2 [Methanomassiliicoccales archaeon RumEn M2]MDD2532506.1 translation initiation factor IF-2 [Candidatus Methanomethylophilaceae archaeon]MDD3128414.1 translation initiation factor IF-2 [Candidatus Methanomethylophilaceae archaeon]MDD4119876.1 translation initiation factor IF-2 [Candidatus Methanomethylophilaceae archaeon]